MSITTAIPHDEDHKEQQSIRLAMIEGIKYGFAAFCVSAPTVYAINQYSPLFRKSLGPSGKVACIVIPTFGTAMLLSELTLLGSLKDPLAYGIELHDENQRPIISTQPKNYVSTLSLHHRAANWAYENPFRILGLSLIPVVGSVFYGQTGDMKTHLKLSQKVMHTRIFSQATIITTLLGLMVFRDYMDTHGKFKEENEEEIKLSAIQEKKNMEIYAQELIKEAKLLHTPIKK
eukprot:336165_1